jgi:hypothetical protein
VDVEIVGVVLDGAWRGRGALGRIPSPRSLEGAPPGMDAGGNQGKSQNAAFTREGA